MKNKKIIRLILIEISKKSEILTLRGRYAYLRRNLHLFLENIEPRTEHKNLKLGKTF